MEQTVWNAAGQLAVTVHASDHRYHTTGNLWLPHRIEVQLPLARVAFELQVSQYDINGPLLDPAELWEMPEFPGHQRIDLASGQPLLPSTGLLPAYETADRAAFLPRIRGYGGGMHR